MRVQICASVSQILLCSLSRGSGAGPCEDGLDGERGLKPGMAEAEMPHTHTACMHWRGGRGRKGLKFEVIHWSLKKLI